VEVEVDLEWWNELGAFGSVEHGMIEETPQEGPVMKGRCINATSSFSEELQRGL